MNMLKLSAAALFFILSANTLFAQSDSVLTDTVVIVGDPVIMRKQIYLGDGAGGSMILTKMAGKLSAIRNRLALSLYCNVSHGNMNLAGNGGDLKINSLSYTQGEIGMKIGLKKIFLSIGAGIMENSFSYSVYSEKELTREETVQVNDYSNAGTLILPGRIIFTGVVTKDSSYLVNYTSHEESRRKIRSYYIAIPVSLSYRMNLENNKWYILPEINISPLMLQTSGTELNLKRFNVLYGGMVSLGHDFSEKLSTQIYFQIRNSLNNLYESSDASKFKISGFGIGVSYKL